MRKSKPKIIFMGSPELSVIFLDALLKAEFPIVGVVTQPDKPAGRGQKLNPPPVKVFAEQHQLKIFQPLKPKDPAFVQELRELQPDFIVVVAYGRILSQELIDLPSRKCLNVHFSLLPRYRGASCVLSAIRRGDAESGVTVMEVVEALDAGPIYLQEKMAIEANETTGELEKRLAELGAPLLLGAIEKIESGDLKAQEQNESEATFAPLIAKEEGKIDWQQNAEAIHDHIRAMNPWPGAFTDFEGKKWKVWKSVIPVKAGILNSSNQDPRLRRNDTGKPGQILSFSPQGLEVACGKGSIFLTTLQPESKKRLNASELLAGYRNQFSIGKAFS